MSKTKRNKNCLKIVFYCKPNQQMKNNLDKRFVQVFALSKVYCAAKPFWHDALFAFITKTKYRASCYSRSLTMPSPDRQGRALKVDVTQHLAPTPPES